MRAFIIVILICFGFGIHAKPLDSLRVEVIKGSRFIIHKVDKNETLQTIVKRYKTTAAEIAKHNDIRKNVISKGQLLKIPLPYKDTALIQTDSSRIDEAHANAQGQEVQKVYTHVVVQGETVNSIAKKYKITPAQLTKWNGLKSTKLIPNQVLVVDENAVAKPNVRLNGTEGQPPLQAPPVELAKADLVEQTGLAAIDETMQVAHSEAPVGTIIKVINLDNNMQCLVKVTAKIDPSKYENFIITFGKEAQQKLKADGPTVRVKLMYMVKP